MDEHTFQYVLSEVIPHISKHNTHLRTAISAEDRLTVTLRFLATGESYSSLQYSTRIPQCTLSKIIPETCEAIYKALKDHCLKVPTSRGEWEQIAEDFEKKWNCYNTIGAMDGKHIRIKCPQASGSHFFNYKSFNSIILFAMVDASYKFLYVDVGTNGRVGDAGVFSKSKLRECLIDRSMLNIPDGRKLGNTNITTPMVVLADDAFPLSYNIMKPYPLKGITKEEKVFNYRLSRGRRLVESSFGILASRFRIFLTTINLPPEKVTTITLAACTLHNLLTERRKHLYTRQETVSAVVGDCTYLETQSIEDLQQMEPIACQAASGRTVHGRAVREYFKTFYNGAGKVPWQDNHI
ncbi:uncharacterized protein LOC126191157 [Schistocerca cancellata]|uniref:uncharacterized protein LOC126148666 n=1 Tax=Schistocerca cancellata TaxID=274614 RepID=UPI0021196A38|nr:uncharacterized protein LOC126148666 [Schistocerca cancellata]XP_049787885.1 uncharacterized protein LOC126191157 [Schistocerca cancellata]